MLLVDKDTLLRPGDRVTVRNPKHDVSELVIIGEGKPTSSGDKRYDCLAWLSLPTGNSDTFYGRVEFYQSDMNAWYPQGNMSRQEITDLIQALRRNGECV